MKVKIREVVSHEADVDLQRLTPFQKISVAVRKRIYNSRFAQRSREKQQELEFKDKVAREERLKVELLSEIHNNLVNSEGLRKVYSNKGIDIDSLGIKCEAVVLAVDRSFEQELYKLLNHKEFSEFKFRILDVNRDMLRSFEKIPILLEVRNRV